MDGRTAVTACAVAGALVAPVGSANAAEYPERAIRMILPGPPGGGADTLARVLSQKLAGSLRQNIVIDNRAGAGGLIGMDMAAKAAPDGYTIVMGNSGPNAVIPNLQKKPPYDPVKDFAPITLAASTTNILVVHPSVPATSLKDLISLGKSKRIEITYASGGSGQPSHLSGELFRLMAGIDATHVPYKGSGPAILDLIGGRVTMMFANVPSAGPQVAAGKLRALAVTSATRSKLVPDLPTMAESGLPGYESSQWYGVLAPAGTPQRIVTLLNRELVAAIRSPDMQETLAKQGFDPAGSTPAAFADYIRAELAKWKKVIAAAGIPQE